MKILDKVRRETGLLIITEATDHTNIEAVEQYADIIQIGARNMHNYSLLRRAGPQAVQDRCSRSRRASLRPTNRRAPRRGIARLEAVRVDVARPGQLDHGGKLHVDAHLGVVLLAVANPNVRPERPRGADP